MNINPKITKDLSALNIDIKIYKKANNLCLNEMDILKGKVKSLEHILFKLVKSINDNLTYTSES